MDHYVFVFRFTAVALRVLFRMYERENRKSEWATVESHIVEVSTRIFADFTPETKDVWAPPVVLVLREILHLNDERVCQVKYNYNTSD